MNGDEGSGSSRRYVALEVLSRVSGRPIADIATTHDLIADLGIDSPKSLELLVELEDGLGLEINDEEAARMQTVGDVLDFAAWSR